MTRDLYTKFVAPVRNITFTAPAETIERARLRAAEQHTTLKEAFRAWLDRYLGGVPPRKNLTGS